MLEEVGSDHLPIYSKIYLTSAQASMRNDQAESASSEEKGDAAKVMVNYREYKNG